MPEFKSIAVALAERFVHYKDQIELVSAQLRHHKHMMDLCPLPAYLCNADGGCVYVNKIFLEMLGINLVDIQGQNWRSLIAPEDRERLIEAWTAFVQDPEQKIFECEFSFMRANGTRLRVLSKGQMQVDKSIVGFCIPERFANFTEWLRGADLDHLPDI